MSNQPISLSKEAIDAHGGFNRWRSFKGVASTIITGGRLWDIKNPDGRHPRFSNQPLYEHKSITRSVIVNKSTIAQQEVHK